MHQFKYLELTNYVRYKIARLPLDHKGVTVIRGDNKKAGKGASNGSGKSVLVGALPNLFFDQTPMAASASHSRKGTFGTNTKIEIGLNDLTIKKFQRKKKLSYKFFQGKKDLKVRTAPLAKKKLPEIFPLSEEEFYSFVYIDARRHLLFSLGSAAKRFEFFTNIFRLTTYDEVRKFLNSKISGINKDKSLLSSLKIDLAELQKEKIGSLKDMRTQIAELREARQNQSENQRKIFEKISKAKELKRAQETKKKIDAFYKEVGITKLIPYISELQKNIKTKNEWAQYRKEEDKFITRSSNVKRRLKDCPYKSANEVRKLLKEQKEIYKEQEELRERIADIQSSLSKLQEDFDEEALKGYEKAKKYTIKQLTRIREKATGELAMLRTFEQSLHKHAKGDKCPVCLSEVKGSSNIIEDLQYRIESVKDTLLKVKKHLKAHASYDASVLIDKLKTQLAKTKKQLVEVDLEELQEALVNLTELEALVKPKEPKTKEPKQKLSYYEELLERANECVILKEQISTVDFTSKLNLKQLETDLEDVEEALSKSNSQLEKLTSRYEVAKQTKKQILEKQSKIASLEHEAKDLEVWTMLLNAYKTDGLKSLMIRRIASLVQDNLNLYASLLFHEPYKFEISIGKGSFEIVCYLVDGKQKAEQRDIRVLSGAESRAFNLLFSLSVLPLIPQDRRANIIVLDEPDTNFDERMTRHFVEDFLPKLNSIIPHIIVVTPLKTKIPNAREFTAIKDADETRLVEKRKV